MGFEEDAGIDMYSLHTELARNPKLIADWRKAYGRAKGEEALIVERNPILKADAKADFERQVAELEMDLRENWDNYFDRDAAPKQTDKSIAAKLQTLPEYIKARSIYTNKVAELAQQIADAVEAKETLYGACRAMEGKETSLVELVKLYMNGYYGSREPKVPKEFIEESEREVSTGIRKALKSKRMKKE